MSEFRISVAQEPNGTWAYRVYAPLNIVWQYKGGFESAEDAEAAAEAEVERYEGWFDDTGGLE